MSPPTARDSHRSRRMTHPQFIDGPRSRAVSREGRASRRDIAARCREFVASSCEFVKGSREGHASSSRARERVARGPREGRTRHGATSVAISAAILHGVTIQLRAQGPSRPNTPSITRSRSPICIVKPRATASGEAHRSTLPLSESRVLAA